MRASIRPSSTRQMAHPPNPAPVIRAPWTPVVAQAIADSVEESLRLAGHKAVGVEGRSQGRWVLLDFGELVVHVFHRPVREYYEIERLYADAPRIALEEPAWLQETSPDYLVEHAGDVGELLWQSVDVDENLDDLDASEGDSEFVGEDELA